MPHPAPHSSARATLPLFSHLRSVQKRCGTLSWEETLKTSTETQTKSWTLFWDENLDDLECQRDVKRDCWHFHQLLHQLRLAKRDLRRDVLETDPGHIDNLHGDNRHKRGEELEDFWQLFHHQRHRNIEHWRTHECLDNLLHGVPLCPLVRPRRLCQAGRPRPCGVFVAHFEEHRFPGHSGPRRAVRGLSGPCRLLSVGRRAACAFTPTPP